MAVDLEASVSIVLAGGGLLTLGDAPYVIESITTPGRQWRRATVEGRYQHGRALLGAVLEAATLVIDVRVQAANWVAEQSALGTLINAVSRRSYLVDVEIDGHVDEWTCEMADVALAESSLEKHLAMSGMQTYRLTIPAYPLPLPTLEIA
jgi:type II secretory pathway component PulM